MGFTPACSLPPCHGFDSPCTLGCVVPTEHQRDIRYAHPRTARTKNQPELFFFGWIIRTLVGDGPGGGIPSVMRRIPSAPSFRPSPGAIFVCTPKTRTDQKPSPPFSSQAPKHPTCGGLLWCTCGLFSRFHRHNGWQWACRGACRKKKRRRGTFHAAPHPPARNIRFHAQNAHQTEAR